MGRIMRYPARMEKLTVDTLRTLARAQGFEPSDGELAALLPPPPCPALADKSGPGVTQAPILFEPGA